MSTGSDPRPGTANTSVAWSADAVVRGWSREIDARAFAIAAVVLLGVLPLAAIDTVVASSGTTFLVIAGVGIGAAVLVWCTFVLICAHRRSDEQSDEGPAAVRRQLFLIAWSVIALAYGIEMVSTSSVLLGGTTGLWTARGYFLWHVADTLPVFSVPETLDLQPPNPGIEMARWSALVLKIALILPLFRMAVALFRLADGEDGSVLDPATSLLFFRAKQRRSGTVPPTVYLLAALRAIGVVAVSGAVLTVLLTVCNWTGPVTRAIASGLPGPAARQVRAVGAALLAFLGSWAVQTGILLVLSIALVLTTLRVVRRLLRVDLGVRTRVALGAAVLFASFVSLLLMFSAATAVDLALTAIVDGRPPMIEAFGHLEWYAWHSFDVVPELTVPGVLDWSRPVRPTALWAGPLLLFVKLVTLLVVAVPVARVARAARRTWSGGAGA